MPRFEPRPPVEASAAGLVREDSDVGTGWECHVLANAGEVALEQLDAAGEDWFASGPGGEHMGSLEETLDAALGGASDPEWLAVVVATIKRDCGSGRRSALLVKRAVGTWFHATFSGNRDSISRHGLDWARMSGTGIAGSLRPEAEGVFLCSDLDDAQWFAQMGRRRGRPVDVWAVALDGTLLIGDPGASGGGDDVWMICPEPIPAGRLTLVRNDL